MYKYKYGLGGKFIVQFFVVEHIPLPSGTRSRKSKDIHQVVRGVFLWRRVDDESVLNKEFYNTIRVA
jgi:hypothetical protein